MFRVNLQIVHHMLGGKRDLHWVSDLRWQRNLLRPADMFVHRWLQRGMHCPDDRLPD